MDETQNRPTDLPIIEVREALRSEPLLQGQPIFVTVEDGAAGLYGQVATRSQALAAERAVLAVPGVYAVAQNLLVSTAPRLSDTDIAHGAAHALKRTPHIPDTVTATVANRHITLTGEVDWQYEREAACRAVDELPGADAVDNCITVGSGMAIELQELIRTTLANRDPLSGLLLTVSTNGRGEILLDGSVPTVEARREAEAICWGVPGAKSVTSHLSVAAN
jgi:osmotically-inducible protein OsmY